MVPIEFGRKVGHTTDKIRVSAPSGNSSGVQNYMKRMFKNIEKGPPGAKHALGSPEVDEH